MAKSKARYLGELLGSDGLVQASLSALAGPDGIVDLEVLPTIPNAKLENSTITISGNSISLGGSHSLDTSDVSEHASYLYYTDTRVGSYLTTNSYATQTYVNTAVSNLVDSAPATLDTLNELAAALGDDPNFATTVSTSIGTKWTQDNTKISNWDTAYTYSQVGHLPLAGGTMSGALTVNAAVTLNSVAISGAGTIDGLNGYNTFYGKSDNTTGTAIYGGSAYNTGGGFVTYGNSHPSKAGETWFYYDGFSERMVINSTGVDVTGTVTADGLNVVGTIESTGSLAFINKTSDARMHIGANSGGYSGVFASRYLSDSGALRYGTYWAYDAYWDDTNQSWYANRTNLTNKTVIEQNYHQGAAFKFRYYGGDASSGWADSAWTDLVTISTGGGLYTSGNIEIASGSSGLLRIDNSSESAYDLIIQNAWDYDGWFRVTDGGGTTRFSVGRNNEAYIGGVGAAGSKVWHAGNDGSGSGLDADLLDGIQAASFLRSDASDTTTGSLTVNGALITDTIRDRTGTQLFLLAGEAATDATQTAEKVYVNAEGGFEVAASNDNWATGYAGTRKTLIDYNGITYNGNEVWHAGNDGSGSGLDADLLDGQQGSYYAPATGGNYVAKSGDTMTGTLTTTSGNNAGIYIGSGGANITSVTPASKDIVVQDCGQFRMGGANWDWNAWAGWAWAGGTNPIYFGGPASSAFTANASPPIPPLLLSGVSYTQSDGSMRAPIFYDSNDTGYYVDPASLTNLNSLRVDNPAGTGATEIGTIANDSANGYTRGSIIFSRNDNQITWDTGTNLWTYDGGSSTDFSLILSSINEGLSFFVGSGVTTPTTYTHTDFKNNFLRFNINSSGEARFFTDVRSPLYYDYNDTGFYVNPAGSSRLNILDFSGSSNLTGSSQYIQFNSTATSGGFKMHDSGDTLKGYFYFDSSGIGILTGGSWGLKVDYSGNNFATTSSRAPIFYDSDNTSYYVNPASNSSFGGYLTLTTSNDAQLYLNGGGTSWAGISFADSGGSDYLWFNGVNGTFAFGGAGSNVAGKKLHVDGGLSVGANSDSVSTPTDGIYSEGFADIGGYNTANIALGVKGGHSSARIHLQYEHSGAADSANNSDLLIWTSEPAQTYDGCGIGGNIYPTGPYYGRADDNNPYGTYMRFEVNSGEIQFWTTTATANSTSGQGTRQFYIDASGNTHSTTSSRAPIFYDLSNTSYYWYPNYSSAHRFNTASGYLIAGPQNTSYCHFSTDRGSFYFDKTVTFDGGGIRMYDTAADVRSYIFYDQNDSSYYVDPNSTSVLNDLTVNGLIYGNGTQAQRLNLEARGQHTEATLPSGWGDYVRTWEFVETGDWSYGYGYVDNINMYSNSASWQFFYEYINTASSTIRFRNSTYSSDSWYAWREIVDTGGATQTKIGSFRSSADIRAPIFYDSDDTGYSINPAGNSFFHEIRIDDILRHDDDTDTYFQFHAADQARIVTGGSERFEVNNTYVMANNQFRTPLIYDLNDTAYYFDGSATGTSINVAGDIAAGGNIYGKSVNGAYSNLYRFGGIYFTWDSDSYGTNFDHSITSSDGGSYGDHITLNSYGNVRINFDSNNNGVNYFRIGSGTTGTVNVLLTIDESGNATFAGNVTAYSDRRLKENVVSLEDSLDKVKSMRGVYYNMINDAGKKRRIGVIAQEIQEILPEVVIEANPEDDKDNILAVDYGNIVPVLIEAIKEQQIQIDELKAKLESR